MMTSFRLFMGFRSSDTARGWPFDDAAAAVHRHALEFQCPIWIDWRVSGTRIRKPIGLSDWQLAQQRARKWEAEGMHGVTAPQTVKAACDAFIDDAKARDLKEATRYKYDLLFRQL